MPELPEVETVRRQLEPELVGKRIEKASILDERLTRPEPPRAVEKAVSGRTVEAVKRRGKYLLIELDGDRTLALHLRMTGNLLLRGAGDGAVADLMETETLGGPRLYESAPEPSHVRARFPLDDGGELIFTDLRRFGQAIVLDAGDELEDYFAARLGVEPLSGELTPEVLLELASDRKAPLKSFLLTQTRVAGSGTSTRTRLCGGPGCIRSRRRIDEARARRAPCERDRRRPRSGSGSRWGEHRRLSRRARREGLDAGGVPSAHPRRGAVPRGDGGIQRIVVTGRSTYYCPGCQERLRKRPRRRKAGREPDPRGRDERADPLPDGFSVGHWSDPEGLTGCSVVIRPPGTRGGVWVQGEGRGPGDGHPESAL
jgi:formamidopyrimidine-DNA glycosylase